MATILIPTALRQYADDLNEIILQGVTVKEILFNLGEKYPDLQKHLFTENKTLRSFVNVYLNEEDIRDLEGIDTAISEGDTVILVPSIAGGR